MEINCEKIIDSFCEWIQLNDNITVDDKLRDGFYEQLHDCFIENKTSLDDLIEKSSHEITHAKNNIKQIEMFDMKPSETTMERYKVLKGWYEFLKLFKQTLKKETEL